MAPEVDFLGWLDRRDGAALARVFDALGGRLLLLAGHLTRGGADARDLVQATFVAAMAHGGQWDRRRPLWPWFATILHNESRMHTRRQRRRREVELDASDSSNAADDPGRIAAAAESFDVVVRTIDSLPVHYRQVLRLRLVHGLQPTEIAQTLEIPVGTVRAQLHRGLAQLRGTLPAGIATALVAWLLGDGDLLAQARTFVLARAAGPSAIGAATTASPWLLSGVLTMNSKHAVGLVLGLALAAWLTFAVILPATAQPTAPEPLQPAVGSTAPTTAPTVPVATNPPERLDRTDPDPANAKGWSLVVHVQDPNGKPIPDADVSVWTAPEGGSFWNRSDSDYLRSDVAQGRSDARGEFRSSLDDVRNRSEVWRATHWVWAEARLANAKPRRDLVQLPVDPSASPLDLTLELKPTNGIVGRVLDAHSQPIANAQIGDERSIADGTFFLPIAADDEWPARLLVADSAHGATHVAVPASSAAATVDLGDIVLASSTRVLGRAVLGDGSPIAGIQVRLVQIDASLGTDLAAIHRWLMGRKRSAALAADRDVPVWTTASANSGRDGSFRFAGLDAAATFLLSIEGVRPVEVVVRPVPDPMELRIDQQLLTIEVSDASGEALPGASIHLDGFDPAGTHASWKPRPGFPTTGQVCGNLVPCGDDDGRRVLLSPFGFVWCLYTTDEAVQPFLVRHEALAGLHRATCRVTLQHDDRRGHLRVVARDESGAPVHYGFSLQHSSRDLHVNNRRTLLPPEGVTLQLPVGRWRLDAVLGKEKVYLHGDSGFARGEQTHEIEIEHDRTTELRLVAPAAGLVAFEPHGAKLTPEALRSVRIEAAGRAVDVLGFDPSYPSMQARHDRPKRFLTRQALPPGRHSFVVTAEGFHPVPCEATVVADEVVCVRVEMFARQ